MTEQEKQILQLIKQDRVAQKQLYLEYVKLVSYIALRYVNDSKYAQDVVQNTFVRLFTNIEKFDYRKGSLKSWISKIAVNESIAFLRAYRKVNFSNLETNILNEKPSFDDTVFLRLEMDDVIMVVKMLSPEDRIILDLFYFEEYSHKEISEELNINVESSRINLHRAKHKFHSLWKKINRNEIRGII